MRILIDINHPAHVHYFKNFYKIMTEKGHEIVIVSRDKEIAQDLLRLYDIPFIKRGKGSDGRVGKLLYLISTNLKLFSIAREFKADLFLNFLHPYPSQVAKLLGKTSLVFSDTEHADLHHKLTVPFAKTVYTPSCYRIDLGEKHIRFDGYMELAYLHPNYFKPDPDILGILGVSEKEKYVIVRFVSWKAVHDVGQSGVRLENKIKLVQELSKYAKVFISAEGELPAGLESYRIRIPFDKMHDAIYYSSLLFGESGTMSSEAAVLGTPAIFINSLTLGYLEEQEKKYGLVHNFRSDESSQIKAIEKALQIIQDKDTENYGKQHALLLSECIDTTKLMVDEVLRYQPHH